ncbi:LysR family transcriptional regulator [Shewanella pealeana]|uniref:Transcriptional regulator, LysR family n=1 Tax=Shewanella pealeana (strain ATCC 700345 / ANG-SQ1) TaxID=398579 RepID=A8H2J1_SHEPA|nr:LysR family transcriptional regulator [Shewanella pealeana]ABV86778.1 transcriptional regulator, LysR family [Shewanella pealeana ATCC 700345]
MDIKQLKYLDALITAGSFTKAAERLNMAQPALSQSIKRLEQELGVTLVDRGANKSSKTLSLTAEGSALHQHAKLIIKNMAQAEAHIKSMANLTMGEVRVAVPGMLGSYYLPRRLMAFRHQHSELKLSLFEGGTRDTLRMLQNEDVDIAIITANDLTDEFDSHLLLQEQMVVAVGKEHPLAKLDTVTLQAFFQHELVFFKPGYFHRDWMLEQAEKLGLKANIAFETNLINLIKQVVAQEYGITSVLEMVIEKHDNICAKPFNPPIFLDLHIAWKKQRPISQADKAFVEFLMQNR